MHSVSVFSIEAVVQHRREMEKNKQPHPPKKNKMSERLK